MRKSPEQQGKTGSANIAEEEETLLGERKNAGKPTPQPRRNVRPFISPLIPHAPKCLFHPTSTQSAMLVPAPMAVREPLQTGKGKDA
ncbi:hypothetical protein [Komagataeibacter nataicola]|uniref:hypothetical protein n=1 Tax=Komagataeibacter nataicola TaxID=265960 RepID=UPI0014758D02|nr:hypothetical protein [Komagataeibacter nataicola]